MRELMAFVRRVGRAGKLLARDERLPRWLRVTLLIACLPIPGPVDNAVQVACLVIVLRYYRHVFTDVWAASEL